MNVKRLLPWILALIALALLAVLLVVLLTDEEGNELEVLLPPPAESGDASISNPDGDRLTVAEVTPETVLDVIATLSRADSYARELTVETFWSGGSGTETISVWVRGNALRLTFGQKNILLTENTLWIWYSDDSEILRTEASAAEADRYQRMLTYEELLTGEYEITDAGYVQWQAEPCIFAEYISGAFGYRNRVYISVSNGLLMGAETLDGDTLVYRMSSGPVDISTPEETFFLPPEGNYVSYPVFVPEEPSPSPEATPELSPGPEVSPEPGGEVTPTPGSDPEATPEPSPDTEVSPSPDATPSPVPDPETPAGPVSRA